MNSNTPVENSEITFCAFADSLSGNRGAVSMLQSAIDNLAPARINVFSVYYKRDIRLKTPENVRILDGSPLSLVFRLTPLSIMFRALRMLGLKRAPKFFGGHFAALAESDCALMIGGTTFSDAQKIKVIFNVFCMLPALILGKRIVMYSQTMGPFRTRFNRIAARLTLNRTELVVPRGLESLGCVRGLGLKHPAVEYYDDAAFSLKIEDGDRAEAAGLGATIPRRNGVVGMSVNSIVQRKCRALGIDYLGAFKSFIEYLAERDFTILLIPHSMRPGAKTDHNNDLFAVDWLLAELPEAARAKVTAVRQEYDCKVLREVVGLADLYVASRFHSMISALCTATPVLVYGWGFQKYREVMHEFEVDDFCFDARDTSCENLIREFERLESQRDAITAKIKRNLPKVAASSMNNHLGAIAAARGRAVPKGTEA